ncbi:uncharacterized protein LOC115989711 isoform X1 [Quercus lobata]|uniref:uncharacterized protein LOC115989711 isoform X1 n=1 Tax=Quercus lobata TaxID=97700 RepID=UPI001247C1CF|nr:uncharacterized protein LOC115989711 isoform X1 [Quercus lobata]
MRSEEAWSRAGPDSGSGEKKKQSKNEKKKASTCPHLKSCYKECVQAALDFALSAEDFDELVDPRSLYDHFLGPEPSAYILQLILREERKVATRFNQDKYAHAKGKKNEPLSKLISPLKKKRLQMVLGLSY